MLVVVEMDVTGYEDYVVHATVQRQLDRMRETVLPYAHYGLSIYQATMEDRRNYELIHRGWELTNGEVEVPKKPALQGKGKGLREGDKHNFNTLLQAARNDDLALVDAVRKQDEAKVALICAMGRADDNIYPVPLAVMVEGNPFELFHDPTAPLPEPPPRRIRRPREEPGADRPDPAV